MHEQDAAIGRCPSCRCLIFGLKTMQFSGARMFPCTGRCSLAHDRASHTVVWLLFEIDWYLDYAYLNTTLLQGSGIYPQRSAGMLLRERDSFLFFLLLAALLIVTQG